MPRILEDRNEFVGPKYQETANEKISGIKSLIKKDLQKLAEEGEIPKGRTIIKSKKGDCGTQAISIEYSLSEKSPYSEKELEDFEEAIFYTAQDYNFHHNGQETAKRFYNEGVEIN